MTEVTPARIGHASVVSYRIGGREYPMKTVRECKTCMSPYRLEIEEQVIAGRTYKRIVEELPEDADVSWTSIGNHYRRGHMPLQMTQARQIVESRAAKVGKRIEQGEESLVDGVALMETVVQRTFEAIASGRVEPEVRDGLRAAKLLADLGEYDGSGLDQQAYIEAFTVYQEEALRIMGPEAFEKFGEALAANPVLTSLAQRYEKATGQVVEGEAEEAEAELSGPLDSEG